MLKIEFPRKSSWKSFRCGEGASDPRQQSWNAAFILGEFRKALAQVRFLAANDGQINHEEQNKEKSQHDPTSRGQGKAYSDDDRSQVQGVARVCIGSRSREIFIFADV